MRQNQPSGQNEFFEILSIHERDIRTLNQDSFEALFLPQVIECNYENRSAIFELTVTEDMINFSGALFGGALASLIDNASGMLMRCYSGRFSSPTNELYVKYHRPAFIRDTVRVYAKITSITNSFIDLYAIAYIDDRDAPISTSSIKFFSKN